MKTPLPTSDVTSWTFLGPEEKENKIGRCSVTHHFSNVRSLQILVWAAKCSTTYVDWLDQINHYTWCVVLWYLSWDRRRLIVHQVKQIPSSTSIVAVTLTIWVEHEKKEKESREKKRGVRGNHVSNYENIEKTLHLGCACLLMGANKLQACSAKREMEDFRKSSTITMAF